MEQIIRDDLVWEHIQHNTYQDKCSECFAENLLLKAQKKISVKCECPTHEDMLKKHPALQNPYGSNYPTGYVPE